MLVSCCGGAIDPARKNDLAYAAHLCCGMHAAVGAAFAQRDEFFLRRRTVISISNNQQYNQYNE